ncbi:MAG: hypothetical protein ACHQRM_01985 [Bacteroidia bacterium]
MKNVAFLMAIGTALLFNSCGPKKPDAIEVPKGFQLVDLNPYGFSASIIVPDSITVQGQLEIKQSAGVEIKRGKAFDIVINTAEGELADMTKQKSFINAEEPKKVKRWILDEPTAITYEQQIADLKPEVHIYCIMQIGNMKYAVTDNHNGEDTFNETNAKMMMDAAKSIKAMEAPKKPN